MDNKELQEQIKSGLMAYYLVAKHDLKKRWKSMDKQHKFASARSLTKMYEVAVNPEHHLSKADTEGAWRARAAEYAKEYNITPEWEAFYIVQDPIGLILGATQSAYIQPLASDYYHFLNSIQKYEYLGQEDYLKKSYAAQVVERATEIRNIARIKSERNPLKRVALTFKNMVR